MLSVLGPAAMLAPCSHHAPYFLGEGGESLDDFLCEYEELADGHGLTQRQKAEGRLGNQVCGPFSMGLMEIYGRFHSV